METLLTTFVDFNGNSVNIRNFRHLLNMLEFAEVQNMQHVRENNITNLGAGMGSQANAYWEHRLHTLQALKHKYNL